MLAPLDEELESAMVVGPGPSLVGLVAVAPVEPVEPVVESLVEPVLAVESLASEEPEPSQPGATIASVDATKMIDDRIPMPAG